MDEMEARASGDMGLFQGRGGGEQVQASEQDVQEERVEHTDNALCKRTMDINGVCAALCGGC